MSYRNTFWKGLLTCAALVAISATAYAVTEADIVYIKGKLEQRQEFSRSDIRLAERVNTESDSRIDMDLAWALHKGTPLAEAPRLPRQPLDEYVVTEVELDWFDVVAQGTAVPLGDDAQTTITLPFGFSFYDVTYTQAILSSNGYLAFGTSPFSSLSNIAIPATSDPNGVIFMFWDDLDPDNGNAGNIYTYHDAANSRFIIQYETVQHFPNGNPETFQCILYQNGNIVLQYETVSNSTSCTVGIENLAGTDGEQICFNNGACLTSGSAWLIAQPDGVPNPPTNVVATPGQTSVTFTWDDPTEDTNGNPLTPDGIQIWEGPAGSGTLRGTVGPGVETFTLNNLQSGNYTFNLRAAAAPYFSAAVTVTVVVGLPSYFADFEADNGDLIADQGWEWGTPTGAGPGQAFSGVNCWGTILAGNYANNACYNLDLDQELTVASESASLEFRMWQNCENFWDGMNIKVSTDGGATWEIVQNVEPVYNEDAMNGNATCMADEVAWSGNQSAAGWRLMAVQLGAYNGMTPIIRFAFGSDGSVVLPGFYIDDVTLWGFGEPEFASVSGTVTLDGGNGTMTSVNVTANGIGNPLTHPAANGAYTLNQVLVGNRRITGSLAGYNNATQDIVLTIGGATNVNLTLVRLDPPVPTNLTGTVNNGTGVVTLNWDDSPDPLVDDYPVYRRIRGNPDWEFQGASTTSSFVQTLAGPGIYQYAVSARDNGVSTPVESDLTPMVEVLYGELPVTSIAANGNYDDRIRLNWLEPGINEGTLISYDDGTSEIWFRVMTPNGPNDYFCQRMSPPDDATYPLMLYAATIYMERNDPLPWVALCPPNASNSGADIDNPLYEWSEIGADSTPGWIFAETDGSVFLEEEGDFYIVIQFPPGLTGPGCGSDNGAPDARAYWTNSYPTWNPFFSWDWMMRAWVGGPPPQGIAGGESRIELIEIDGRGGYAEDRIPQRTIVTPEFGNDKASMQARADYEASQGFTHPLDQWFAPYSRAPEVELRLNGRNSLDEIVNYRVYRDGVMVGEPVETNYFDLGRTENVDYDYYVTAYYDNGNESGPSPTVTRACNMAPDEPLNLTGTPQGLTDMVLTWNAPTTNDDDTPLVDLAGYRVYRGGVLIGTTGAGVTTFTDTPDNPAFFYTWTVTAIDEVPNESDPSAGVTAAVVSPWEPTDYEWIDITGNGTVIVNADDINSGMMDLPWEFEFYGGTYDQFSVCSNGFLSFTSTSASLGNGAIPSTFEPNTAVYAFWDDLNPGAGGDVYMLNDAANDRLIISWVNVPHFGNNNLYTFQMILEPPTAITFQYQSMSDVSSGTIGVENEGGTEAIMLWNNGVSNFDFAPDNETAVSFFAEEPTYGPISGHVTLDGGTGSVTQVLVRASGRGSPTTNPNAAGDYFLPQVATGNRTVTGSLAGYHTTVVPVANHDEDGTTGVNITMLRLDPPVPTNLTGSVNNQSGLVTLDWDNSPDPLVDVYPVYRRLSTEQDWTLVGTPATSSFSQTLTVDGIYLYAVAARDNGPSVPVESDPTASLTLLFGDLPVTSIGTNGDFDDRIQISWLEPGVLEGELISYDDGTSEVWFRVMTPNGPNDYFCQRMSPPDDATYPLMLYAATIYMERSDPLPWVALCPPNETNAGADIDNPLFVWEEIGADSSPGWIFAETDGSIFLEEEGDFYIVIQFPPGLTGPGCGSDNSAPDSRTFWTNSYPTWNPFWSWDWMMRAWVGGPPPEGLLSTRGQVIEITTTGEPTGYAMDRMPKLSTAEPAFDSKDEKQNLIARSAWEISQSIADPFDGMSTPYSRAPEVTCTISREGRRSLDDITNYRVYRQGSGQIAQVAPTIHSYQDLNRIENTPYTYWVTAVYDGVSESPESPHVTETCNMSPAAPANLDANALGNTQMALAWSAPTTNDDATPLVDLAGYRVYRDGTQIGTTAPGVTTYVDTPPDNQTFYTWTVTAVDEVPNISPPSNNAIAAVVSPWEVVDYEWVDITGNGTVIVNSDDVNSGMMALPWTFEFYGNEYSQFSVCSNGWISFTSTSNSLGGTMPSTFEPNAQIAINWMDLNPGAGGDVYMYDDAANDRLIISWVGVPQFGNPNNIYTMQIILEPPTSIYFFYQQVGSTIQTVGVENADGTDAIVLWQAGQGAFQPANETGVAFWAGPSGAISGLVREFGSNAPIANAEVRSAQAPGEVAFTDAQGNYTLEVEPGTHTVTIHKQGYCDQLFENVVVDDGGTTTRNATLRQPNASFSLSSLNIYTLIGENSVGTFEITNPAGQCEVAYTITTDQNWLTVNPANGEVDANQSQMITVTGATAAFGAGDYTANITVAHNDVDAPFVIPVTITIALSANDDATIPSEFALHANYPNPFNATTALNFDVPTESRVQVTIYNVAGQEVDRPVDGLMSAGRHTVLYTADDLPTGMYLVKMTAGGFTAVQKMVLLK